MIFDALIHSLGSVKGNTIEKFLLSVQAWKITHIA